jgi:hypothetical protein
MKSTEEIRSLIERRLPMNLQDLTTKSSGRKPKSKTLKIVPELLPLFAQEQNSACLTC